MLKIKKLLLFLAIILCFGAYAPAVTLADTSGIDPTACKGVKDGTPTCAQCHPEKGDSPSLCTCHPEYFYGAPLTDDQYKSCRACNNAGLKYDVKTSEGKSALSKDCLENNPIVTRLNEFINYLAALATIVIIAMIIVGGIRYSLAGNPQATAAAKKNIINALMALFVLLFLWAFLRWLVP